MCNKMSVFGRRLFVILCAMSQLLSGSCVGDDGACPTPPGLEEEGLRQLAIHIAPVTTRAESSEAEVTEMIRSLRIIMVHQQQNGTDSVEFNRLIVPSEAGVRATDFQYDFIWYTPEGTKAFYLIANEASVTLSDGKSLSGLLDGYTAGSEPEETLSLALSDLYFAPQYEITDGKIFLPYTSVYDPVEVGKRAFKEQNFFLVPVATKFSFNFVNKREAPVRIKGISLEKANKTNYLFAKVGETDQQKKLPDSETPLYWVDWLAEISKLSASTSGFSENESFNDRYGWISDYEMPNDDETDLEEAVFVSKEEEDVFEVAGIGVDAAENASVSLSKGPYYVPESCNPPDDDNSGGANGSDTSAGSAADKPTQMYYLTIGLEDTVDGKTAPDFTHVAIPNLKALFRNTNVIIHISMSQGTVDVYAEIADWNYKSINGWVTEGQEPSDNPFTQR